MGLNQCHKCEADFAAFISRKHTNNLRFESGILDANPNATECTLDIFHRQWPLLQSI